jgi:hypothetical protein
MFQYRVTKYDPRNRDEAGHYLHDEWTSYSDIGKSFQGTILTVDDYTRVENAYVEVALAFMLESKSDGLRISCLETRDGYHESGLVLVLGAEVRSDQIKQVCRLCLQDKIWCKLEGDGGRFIHFGWDYYMYLGVPIPCENAQALARQLRLFVEPFESPHHAAG